MDTPLWSNLKKKHGIKDSIESILVWCVQNGVSNPTSPMHNVLAWLDMPDGLVCPNRDIIRAEMLDIVSRIAGSPYKIVKCKISAAIRQEVWEKYMRNAIGVVMYETDCAICQSTSISALGSWHASHVVSEADGGSTDVSNLRPLCPVCNIRMGKTNMILWIQSNYAARASIIINQLCLST